jgi:hypothetical protein
MEFWDFPGFFLICLSNSWNFQGFSRFPFISIRISSLQLEFSTISTLFLRFSFQIPPPPHQDKHLQGIRSQRRLRKRKIQWQSSIRVAEGNSNVIQFMKRFPFTPRPSMVNSCMLQLTLASSSRPSAFRRFPKSLRTQYKS